MKKITTIIALITLISVSANAQKVYTAFEFNYSQYESEPEGNTGYEKRVSYNYLVSSGYFIKPNLAIGLSHRKVGNQIVQQGIYPNTSGTLDTVNITDHYKVSLIGLNMRKYWSINKTFRPYIHAEYLKGNGEDVNEFYNRYAQSKISGHKKTTKNEMASLTAGIAVFMFPNVAVEASLPVAAFSKTKTQVREDYSIKTTSYNSLLNGFNLNTFRLGISVYL